METRVGVSCSVGVGPELGGRARNEDNYLVCVDGEVRYLESGTELHVEREGEGLLVAVCDGMGGHDDGDVASLTAVKVLSRLFQPGLPSNPERTLFRYVRDSHHTLHWKAAEAGPVSMGTTLTAAWFLQGCVCWVSVGDSRLYRYRTGGLELLSLDQTRNEFARRDGGEQVPPEYDHLAQNFIFGSRGLGDNSSLRLQPGLDSGTDPLEPGDILLLCSDGVWGALDGERMSDALYAYPEPQEAADALVDMAMGHGATDNCTAIVVLVTTKAPPTVEWTDDFDVLKAL